VVKSRIVQSDGLFAGEMSCCDGKTSVDILECLRLRQDGCWR